MEKKKKKRKESQLLGDYAMICLAQRPKNSSLSMKLLSAFNLYVTEGFISKSTGFYVYDVKNRSGVKGGDHAVPVRE